MRPSRSTARTVLAVLAWVGMGVGGLLILALVAFAAADVGIFTVVSLLGLLPLPVLLAFYWWLGRGHPQPLRYQLFVLGWGAVVAVVVAVFFSFLLIGLVSGSMTFGAVVVAPVVEEACKGAVILLVAWLRRQGFTGVLDGIVYAGLVGIGFAFTENLFYYTDAYVMGGPGLSGGDALALTFVLRGLFSPFLHPLFVTAIGIGVGVAVMRGGHWWATGPLAGYAAAVGLHALWNGSASMTGGAFVLVYLFVMLPLVLALIGGAIWLRVLERRAIERSLGEYAAAGWLHPAEIMWIAHAGRRGVARSMAKARLGPEAARAVREYQFAFLGLAFLRDALLRGTAGPHGARREFELGVSALALRPYVRLPPPPQPVWGAPPPRPPWGGPSSNR